MSSKRKIAEIAGWYGDIAIISAYALVTFGIISVDGIIFPLLNLTGALGILSISVIKNVKQSVVLNVFWAAIAIVALIRIIIL